MAFETLTARDQEVILRCMKATAAHIEDWEKHTRLGLRSEELNSVIAQWPNIDDSDESGKGFLAINEVCHGFHIAADEWSTWFDGPKADVQRIYKTWLSLKGRSGGIR